MEIPSAGATDNLGAHNLPHTLEVPPAKREFEADRPTGMIASLPDFPQEKQGKQASQTFPPGDFLPEKQRVQALTLLEDHTLPGKPNSQPPATNDSAPLSPGDSTLLATNLSPEKPTPYALEKQASDSPRVQLMPGMHAVTSLSESENKASEVHGIGVLPEKQDREANSTEELRSAQIDTAAPFESVKEAITLLEERIDRAPLQLSDHEKITAPGFDTQKASEEVVRYQKLLREEEASITEISLELEKTKERIQVWKGKAPIISENGVAFPPESQPEESSNAGAPRELYVNLLHELEMVRKEIEDVHKEHALLENSKQSALKEREAAFSALDAASARIKELTTEQTSGQEASAAAKTALAETVSEIDALRGTLNVELDGKSRSTSGGLLNVSNTKSATLKSLELNLIEANTTIEKLKEELAKIRNVKVTASSSVSNSNGEIMREELRLEQAKAAEGDQVAAIGRVLEELDEVRTNLSKVTRDGAPLALAVGGLQAEVEKHRVELESAQETEQIACATLASLQDELCSIRAVVLPAHAGEAKAREAKRTYPIEIKRLAFEADEAKATSKLAKEATRKGKLELEQAKAAMNTAVCRLQAAQKEAEAARASEAMAIAEFTAMSESEGDLADSKEGSGGGKVVVSIPLEEYRALNETGHGAGEAANQKVAATLVLVEAAKAGEKNAEAKLDAVMNELEELQKAMEEAKKKADDAQTEKLSVEAELRKWRAEHEQRRRTGSNASSVSTSAAQSPLMNARSSSQGKVVSHSFQGKPAAGLDSLAEVLSLKLPAAEKAIQILPVLDSIKKPEKAKKVSLFRRVMSILFRKKSKSGKQVSNAYSSTV